MLYMTSTFLFVLVPALLMDVQGANILGIFPFPGASSNIVCTALTEELLKRGHKLTIISPFPKQSNSSNLEHIQISYVKDKFLNFFGKQKTSRVGASIAFMRSCLQQSVQVMEHPEVQKLIHSKDRKYDAILALALLYESLLGFSHKFQAPIIQICAFEGGIWMGDYVGNPHLTAYLPDIYSESTEHMSFWERLSATLILTTDRILHMYLNNQWHEEAMKKFFNDSDSYPPLTKLIYNTSLLMVNGHFSMTYPKPLVPNLVQVGGLHVKPPKKLPEDLQKFLDESPEGVVYFSLGSILKSSNMPEDKRNAFLQVFSKLKQKVLWKLEVDSLPGQPENLKLGKWLPQSDILAHPNVKLFISHCGLLGIQEATTYGVPILGIPVFGDQIHNIKQIEKHGYGVRLTYENITAESLSWAIETALQPRYREAAQRVSRLLLDRPLKPLDEAVYWTEYVIRHKGAPHMRSAALDLTWYQYLLLDVIAVVALFVIIFIMIFFCVLKAVWNMCHKCVSTREPVRKKWD